MAIRKTLAATQAATYAIALPHSGPQAKGLPTPRGTGFFVSPDGWFVTAAHVVIDSEAVLRVDLQKFEETRERDESAVTEALLEKEARSDSPPVSLSHLKLEHVNLDADIALLKADLEANKEALKARGFDEFPYLPISRRTLEEGEPVYAFGYPLSRTNSFQPTKGIIVATSEICPRTTSAIVSSTIERTGFMGQVVNRPPESYVLDRALNYGNSGGPIVASETGHVHAVCSKFQPVEIPQPHLADELRIMIPSLYGVVSSLGRQLVLDALNKRGIPIEPE